MSTATALQWFGAAGILTAFGLAQRDLLAIDSVRYLTMNLVAGTCLCWAAVLTSHWGFVLLEGAWALIALGGLVRGRRTESERGTTS